MDWPSFGLIGTHSLVINRKHANGLHSTVEVGFPGFVGTLTGMNSQGLSIAMNVCQGQTTVIKGMPAAFYNRACLERCRTAKDVEDMTRKESPLGVYHVTVADQEGAQSIHFHQGFTYDDVHSMRRWQENKPLATLNYRYRPDPYLPMCNSEERQEILDDFFKHRGNRPLEDALTLPFVNNWLTTHRVVMEPKSQRFRVAFDNAFAGKAPLHDVPTQSLFGRIATKKG